MGPSRQSVASAATGSNASATEDGPSGKVNVFGQGVTEGIPVVPHPILGKLPPLPGSTSVQRLRKHAEASGELTPRIRKRRPVIASLSAVAGFDGQLRHSPTTSRDKWRKRQSNFIADATG